MRAMLLFFYWLFGWYGYQLQTNPFVTLLWTVLLIAVLLWLWGYKESYAKR